MPPVSTAMPPTGALPAITNVDKNHVHLLEPHAQGLAEPRDRRGAGAVLRGRHSDVLGVRAAVHALRPVLHRDRRAVHAEPPDADRGRLAVDRQPSGQLQGAVDAGGGHPVAPDPARAGRAHVGQLRRLRLRVRQGARRKAAPLDAVRHRRRSGQAADRLVGLREPRPQRACARHRRRPAERCRQRHERLGVDGTAGRGDRRRRALGQDRDLHHVGRLGRLGRPRRSAGGGEVDRRHAVPLRQPCPVPRPRRVCEGGPRLAPAAFARQSRPLLRDDVRSAVAERAHRRRGRHGRLLRLHARAAAAERDARADADADANADTNTDPPPVPTAHLLTEIAAAAARANDRIAAAAAASTDASIKQQLRYAAMDVDRVTSLATGGS